MSEMTFQCDKLLGLLRKPQASRRGVCKLDVLLLLYRESSFCGRGCSFLTLVEQTSLVSSLTEAAGSVLGGSVTVTKGSSKG